MLGVMIVDDEVLVRVGLRTMIRWEALGCRVVGDASNGEEALALLEERDPDIVITDVKMPVMDGLQMIRRAREAGCRAKFLILSSYDEFPLVREAMRLGAEDYLIKLELDEAALARVIEAVGAKIAAEAERDRRRRLEEASREAARKEFFAKLIDRVLASGPEIEAKAAALGIELGAARLACSLVQIVEVAPGREQARAEERALLDAGAEGLLVEMARDLLPSWVLRRGERRFVVVSALPAGPPAGEAEERLLTLARRIVAGLHTYLSAVATVGVSDPHPGLDSLAEAFAEASTAAERGFFLGPGQVIAYRDAKAASQRCGEIEAACHLKELEDACEYYDERKVESAFDGVEEALARGGASREAILEFCCELAYKLREVASRQEELASVAESIGTQQAIASFPTLQAALAWVGALRRAVTTAVREAVGPHALLVRRAKKYVRDHMDRDLPLAEVARFLGVNHCHLSTLFKQQTGEGFSEYVARIKIEEACRLLATGRYRVYEVADMLGYASPYYFSTLFKRITSMTPRAFLEQCSGGGKGNA